jgi:hypothetical protein
MLNHFVAFLVDGLQLFFRVGEALTQAFNWLLELII